MSKRRQAQLRSLYRHHAYEGLLASLLVAERTGHADLAQVIQQLINEAEGE